MNKINIYYNAHVFSFIHFPNYINIETYYLWETKKNGTWFNWRYIEKGWKDTIIYNNKKENRVVGILPKRYVYSGID